MTEGGIMGELELVLGEVEVEVGKGDPERTVVEKVRVKQCK